MIHRVGLRYVDVVRASADHQDDGWPHRSRQSEAFRFLPIRRRASWSPWSAWTTASKAPSTLIDPLHRTEGVVRGRLGGFIPETHDAVEPVSCVP